MFEATVSIDGDVLSAIYEALEQAPRTTATIVNRAILPEFTRRVQEELTPYPPPYSGKRRWNSERQHRAYFATDGFGAGIPYQRTGALGRAWELSYTELPDGGQISVRNIAKTRRGEGLAQYVVGERQQIMHRDSGWPNAIDRLERIQGDLTDSLIDVYFSVVDTPPGTRFI